MRVSDAIYFAIAYADIFDYPYTLEEVVAWIPGNWSLNAVKRGLTDLCRKKRIERIGDFYCLRGRKKIVSIRRRRTQETARKMDTARLAASILRTVPGVALVGVTGGLSLGNADPADDIDLYIGTQPHTVWSTRLACTFLMEWYGMRRRPDATDVRDRICLNMFVDRERMGLPVGERDIYTAHEVLQLIPLFERTGAYRSFLLSNRWVAPVFPIRWKRAMAVAGVPSAQSPGRRIVLLLQRIESVMKAIQLRYMQPRRTSEVISDRTIRFHPNDARIWITEGLRRRGVSIIPLDKKNIRP